MGITRYDNRAATVIEMLPPVNHASLEVMSVELAHHTMQRHRECMVTECPAKRQAKACLIEAHRLVPADQPHF